MNATFHAIQVWFPSLIISHTLKCGEKLHIQSNTTTTSSTVSERQSAEVVKTSRCDHCNHAEGSICDWMPPERRSGSSYGHGAQTTCSVKV
ncbi:hypothetical protein PFLUV_G00009740 [Perca fluviatilis]|uniref:Uncharacterized protein n=1 Tax=Perca fluviatilis TaxID=8168 RepID=A0A6A5FQB8_PERFL|nr:hypothetical protein PFLUV_G00009740 [Perca fluviatilis]